MKYVEYLNALIKKEIQKKDRLIVFGQNINGGSCLGGLTKEMVVKTNSRIINSTNSENSLVGFGFGLMMNRATGIFFMKQMDFLLLGIDQLVNTYNIIRSIKKQPKEGSFTIVSTVVDSGFDGPQSSLNNFADFCSIARIPGFAITNKTDADYIFKNHFARPGFRIIGLSQRLGKTEIIDPGEPIDILGECEIFQYLNGKDATVVSFNFSFPQAKKLCKDLENNGIYAKHFNVNSAIAVNWTPIRASALRTENIVVIDDSKSTHTPADSLLADLCGENIKKIVIKRELGENWLYPVSDVFEINEKSVMRDLILEI